VPNSPRWSSSSTYAPKLDEEFKFLYYDNCKIGMNIECQNNKTNIRVKLGTLTNKAYIGNPQEPDTLLTFSTDGIETFHMIDNIHNKYRQY